MLTIEQRVECAIVKTIAQCHNFIRKDAVRVKEMLHEWGIRPYKDSELSANPKLASIQQAMPDNATITRLIQKAQTYTKGGYSFKSNVFDEKVLPNEELRLVVAEVLRKGDIYEFFEILKRHPPGSVSKGCWDCNTPLMGTTSLPFEILWFLIGPSLQMRQGRLCQSCIQNRTLALTEGKGYAIKT